MTRRFKQIHISADIIASYGKTVIAELLRQLPPRCEILFKREDIDTGCLHVLIYNPTFDLLEATELVPHMNFTMKPKSFIEIVG